MRSNQDDVFFCWYLGVLNKVIMWSSDVEEKLTVRGSVVIGELHLSCWETVVNESDIETFVCFREIVHNVRVMIPGYVVKSYGVPFIFMN